MLVLRSAADSCFRELCGLCGQQAVEKKHGNWISSVRVEFQKAKLHVEGYNKEGKIKVC